MKESKKDYSKLDKIIREKLLPSKVDMANAILMNKKYSELKEELKGKTKSELIDIILDSVLA